jgi:hypothetical protein
MPGHRGIPENPQLRELLLNDSGQAACPGTRCHPRFLIHNAQHHTRLAHRVPESRSHAGQHHDTLL